MTARLTPLSPWAIRDVDSVPEGQADSQVYPGASGAGEAVVQGHRHVRPRAHYHEQRGSGDRELARDEHGWVVH